MAINQPRIQRRLKFLKLRGFDVTVYAFDRGLYGETSHLERYGIKVYIVGKMGTMGWSLKVFWTMLCGLSRFIAREAFRRKEYIYYFGFPPVLLDRALGKAVRIYEIGDLRFSSLHQDGVSRLQCYLENRFLRRVDILVATSPGFVDEFSGRVPKLRNRIVLLENGLPHDLTRSWRETSAVRNPCSRIRFGFVGLFRYLNILLPFLKCVGQRTASYEAHLFGNGYDLSGIKALCTDYENLTYHGKYRNPEDLPGIYSQLDLSLAVYDNTDANVRLALPNKLYESVFFRAPLIVASKTVLAERVLKWGVGYDVDPVESNWADEFLDSFDQSDFLEKQHNCSTVPRQYLGVDMQPLLQAMVARRQ